ncbi:MAG TPA: hypothetical protein VGO92_09465 [Acidimicrobiales bacterium]|nr:hypothetical protein [Acidimicrobiales bacterium]
MPTRVLALLIAVAMVVGAFWGRDRLDQRSADKAHRPRLLCIPELAVFCHGLADRHVADVTVESAGQTASRVAASAGDPGIDGWLTISPWPVIAEQRRARLSLPRLFLSDRPAVLARSPLAVAVWPDRAAVMDAQCKLTWKCLGQVAAKRQWADVPGGNKAWGPVKIAVPDASESAVGVTVLAAASVDFFGGRTDLSTTDLETPAYQDWLSGLVAATPSAFPDFRQVLAAGPSVEDAYASVEADLLDGLAGYARTPRPQLIYPSPVMSADLVLATTAGRAGDRLRQSVGDAVRDRLSKRGWRVPGLSEPAGASAALPPANGVPEPGLLEAFRKAWDAAS